MQRDDFDNKNSRMSYRETIESLRREGNLRAIPEDADGVAGVVDLSLNDYLGLGARRELQTEFLEACGGELPSFTSSASRLLSANQKWYGRLEEMLESLYRRPALIFNSGYHANVGMMQALASEPATLILADKLVHASIIDGIMLSKAPFRRFAHGDFERLEALLEKESRDYERIIVVVESVYSMDGDRADLGRLVEIKRRYPNVLLYVDEAHAFGVEGPRGLGLSVMCDGFGSEIDVIVGTFGKALASSGAFAAMSGELKQYAVNKARSFIFSTALPPICCAWSTFVIGKMVGMDDERRRLRAISKDLFERLFAIAPEACGTAPSHIQPFLVGDAARAVGLSRQLEREGFRVLAIRRPTVPPGTERLRISLSAALTDEDVRRFASALENVVK